MPFGLGMQFWMQRVLPLGAKPSSRAAHLDRAECDTVLIGCRSGGLAEFVANKLLRLRVGLSDLSVGEQQGQSSIYGHLVKVCQILPLLWSSLF